MGPVSEQLTDEDLVVSLYKTDEWHKMVEECDVNKYLPWVWPSEKNFSFIGDTVQLLGPAHYIVSIGCGSGLLEWLINKATGCKVIGVELDQSWWASRYAGTTFVSMVFTEDASSGCELATREDAVLLFCYFNNEKAFLHYIHNFQGSCFIIIGPGEGRCTHTNPQPFKIPCNLESDWYLTASQEIRTSKDHIAVYQRK